MLIDFIPVPLDFLLLALPGIIRGEIYMTRWRKSDLDPQYPKTNWFVAGVGYGMARPGEASAIPMQKYPRFLGHSNRMDLDLGVSLSVDFFKRWSLRRLTYVAVFVGIDVAFSIWHGTNCRSLHHSVSTLVKTTPRGRTPIKCLPVSCGECRRNGRATHKGARLVLSHHGPHMDAPTVPL